MKGIAKTKRLVVNVIRVSTKTNDYFEGDETKNETKSMKSWFSTIVQDEFSIWCSFDAKRCWRNAKSNCGFWRTVLIRLNLSILCLILVMLNLVLKVILVWKKRLLISPKVRLGLLMIAWILGTIPFKKWGNDANSKGDWTEKGDLIEKGDLNEKSKGF